MKLKLGWVLFSLMTVVVIILSSVLISYEVRWKSGEDLLDFYIEDVQSAYINYDMCSTGQPERVEYQLNDKQTQYIIKEFYTSKFQRSNEQYDAISIQVVFNLKDGSERSFSVLGSLIIVNGKKYKCYSYLANYIHNLCFEYNI